VARLKKVSLLILTILSACTGDDQAPDFNCATSTLQISLVQKKDLAACISNSGEVEVQATGGFEPYSFSINGQAAQASSAFNSLSAGNYSIAVLDSKKCTATVSVEINNFTSTLTATAVTTQNSVCLSPNGTLKVKPTGGTAPFSFRINNGTSSGDSLFSNLTHGTYSVFVRDAKNCTHTFTATVPRTNTGVSWSSQIKPILDVSCAKSGCHVAGTGRIDLTKFDVVKSNALQIKSRVVSKSMPSDSSLPADQISLIACWVDDGALDN
jgi:SprB repeat